MFPVLRGTTFIALTYGHSFSHFLTAHKETKLKRLLKRGDLAKRKVWVRSKHEALLIKLTEIFRVTACENCHPRVEQRNRQRQSALFIAIHRAFYVAAIVTETCFCLNVRSSVNLHSSSTPKMILCLDRKNNRIYY